MANPPPVDPSAGAFGTPPNAPAAADQPPADIDEFLAKNAAPANVAAPGNIDEFLARYAPPETGQSNSYALAEGGGVMEGGHWDSMFTSDTPGGRILDAMGAGAKQGWGAGPISWDQSTIDYLKKNGVFQDAVNAVMGPAAVASKALGNLTGSSLIKGYNAALLRPLAWAMGMAETASRDMGAAQEGLAGGVAQAGAELQNVPGLNVLQPELLARDIAGSIETGGPLIGSPGALHVHVPADLVARAADAEAVDRAAVRALNPELLRRGNLAVEPALNPDLYPPQSTIPEARSLAAIGEGDAGYFDLKTPTPEEQAARDAANAEIPPGGPAISFEMAPGQQTGPADIEGIARQQNPDLFAQYDPLVMQRDAMRRQIDDLQLQREHQSSPAIAALDDQLGQLHEAQGQEPANTAAGQQMRRQVTALVGQRQRLVEALPEVGDTAEMAAARQQLMAADERMRDLAPQVAEAYRGAAGTPAEAVAEEPTNAPTTEATGTPSAAETPVAQGAPGDAVPQEAAPAPSTVAPTVPAGAPGALSPSALPIAQDVSRQLVAAGRPTEEADAVGALQAARYEARSANLTGTTPEGLYAEQGPVIAEGTAEGKREAVDISGDRMVVRTMATADASTAIHELGHTYLEELTRDAADPRATPAVTADIATVRDWLGEGREGAARSPSGYTRTQHEKFARGFERYMMEGRAPSQALAGVFAKFKTWLGTIYQTVSRLRSPITDDVRSVFDRMLAAPDRPTTIIPERVEPVDFAVRHENLAERTAPAEAAVVANHVREEADQVAAERDPEIHANLTSAEQPGPGSGVGGDAGTGEQPDRDAATAEPVGGEPATPGPARTVGAGRGAAAEEGAGVSGVATAERPIPSEPGAAGPVVTDIPRTDTRLVDKAGNIRLDNINSPEEWKEALRQAADRNNDFLERRRNVVTDAQRNSLALVLGTTPERVFTKEIGESFTDSEVKMLEKSLTESIAHVAELGAKALETRSDTDIMAATVALTRHDMIQGLYSQAAAESGRTQRAFRKTQEWWTGATAEQSGALRQSMLDATGRTPEAMLQLFQRLQSFDQAGAATKFVRDAMKPGLFDWIQAVWTNAILSNPFTHLTYTASGQVFALYRQWWQTPWQAAVGATMHNVFGREGPSVNIRSVAPETHGYLFGTANGARAAWTALKENQQVIPAEVLAVRKEAGQMVQQAGGIIPNPTIVGREVPVGSALEVPMRVISALHSFNWTTFYEQGKGKLAFQTAQGEGLLPGMHEFAARLADLTQNPTKAMIEDASHYADEGALVTRAPYDFVMGGLSRWLHRGHSFEPIHILGKEIPLGTFRPGMYVDPFVQIQGNILRMAYLNGTPLELFTQAARDDLMGRNGNIAFDLRAGKILAGTSLMLSAGGLYYAGVLNESGPSDPIKAYWWRRTHGMPHGLNVGHLSFNILRMGPLGMQMSVAADLAHGVGDFAKGEVSQAVADLVHAVSQNIIDESAFSGPQRMLEAINNSDRYGAAWIRQFAASLVPYSGALRGAAHMIDPDTRRVRNTVDAMKSIIPWERGLNPRYDYWGQPEPNQGWLMTNYDHLRNDPVDQKLEQLGITPAMPQQWLRGVQLTDDQYADYAREGGRNARQQVEATIAAPWFNSAPPGTQIDMIDKAIERGHRIGATKVIAQSRLSGDNSIMDIAAQRKRAHIETGTPIRQPAH